VGARALFRVLHQFCGLLAVWKRFCSAFYKFGRPDCRMSAAFCVLCMRQHRSSWLDVAPASCLWHPKFIGQYADSCDFWMPKFCALCKKNQPTIILQSDAWLARVEGAKCWPLVDRAALGAAQLDDFEHEKIFLKSGVPDMLATLADYGYDCEKEVSSDGEGGFGDY
jgi:hypothetical protein